MCDPDSRSRLALQLVDNTLLSENTTADDVKALCGASCTAFGQVAAVCVFPAFVSLARELLQGSGVKVATVVNFPHGSDEPAAVAAAIDKAGEQGADEIDVVLPWRALLAGDQAEALQLVQAARRACADRMALKVIIESGELQEPAQIARASALAIEGGADFIKTSTGKTAIHATPEAARVMLTSIRDSGRPVGFKASGGIRTLQDAWQYISLATDIMGKSWIDPAHFRLGASSLMGDLLKILAASGSRE